MKQRVSLLSSTLELKIFYLKEIYNSTVFQYFLFFSPFLFGIFLYIYFAESFVVALSTIAILTIFINGILTYSLSDNISSELYKIHLKAKNRKKAFLEQMEQNAKLQERKEVVQKELTM